QLRLADLVSPPAGDRLALLVPTAALPDALYVFLLVTPVGQRLNELVSRPAVDVVMDRHNAVGQFVVGEVSDIVAKGGTCVNPNQLVQLVRVGAGDTLGPQDCPDLVEDIGLGLVDLVGGEIPALRIDGDVQAGWRLDERPG